MVSPFASSIFQSSKKHCGGLDFFALDLQSSSCPWSTGMARGKLNESCSLASLNQNSLSSKKTNMGTSHEMSIRCSGEMDSCPLCSVDLMGLRLEVLLSFLPTIYSTINKYDPAPVEIFTLCPHISLHSTCGICTDSYICTKTPTAWLIVAHLLATYHP